MVNIIKKFKKKKKDNVSESELSDFMQGEMVKAREGLLYIFAHTKTSGNFASLVLGGALGIAGSALSGSGKLGDDSGLKTAGTVVSGAKTPIDQVVKYFEKQDGAKSNIPKDPALEHKTESVFMKYLKMAWEKLCGDVVPSMSTWGAVIKAIIKGIVAKVCEAAVPLSGIFDVAKGVAQAAHAGWNRINSWLEERATALVSGHPTVIVSAIQRAMSRSLGEGLWNVLKGGVKIGVDVAAAGAGAIAGAIASGLELIVQLVLRIFEIETVKLFCKDAATMWRDRETVGMHRNADVFATWLKKYAMKVPAIGAIAMNCGYCGGPMHYLAMFTTSGELISQKDYDAGVSMLTRLKRYSAHYLNDIGVSYVSDDPVVNGALKAAKNYGKISNIKQNTVGSVVYGLMTG